MTRFLRFLRSLERVNGDWFHWMFSANRCGHFGFHSFRAARCFSFRYQVIEYSNVTFFMFWRFFVAIHKEPEIAN